MRLRVLFVCLWICMGIVAFAMPSQMAQSASSNVTDCGNFTGAGSFVAALGLANSGGGTITFMCSGTITFGFTVAATSNVIINPNGNTIVFDLAGNTFLVNPGAHLTLNDLTVQGGGGLAAIHNQGQLTANNVLFTNNGRAVYNNLAQFFAYSNTFYNNSAGEGGAIYHDGSSMMVITNNTFYGNSATNGGAVYIEPAGISTFTHNTFVNNTATLGGAIYHTLSTTPSMLGNIISGTGSQCRDVPSSSSNITDNSCGSSVVVANLLLGTFNGDYVPLTGGSPAIDLNVALCHVITIDQIGSARPYGAGCDAGSIEAGVVNTLLNTTVTCVGNSLQVTINAGDPNFNISYNSAIQSSGVGLGGYNFSGPATFTNVTVTELGGDTESVNYGTFNCFNTLSASASCDINADLSITITSGDANFAITGAGDSLPTTVTGSITLFSDDAGPNVWTGVSVTEMGGDNQAISLGNFSCNVLSLATQSCNGNDVHINITAGDFPMTLTDVGLNQIVTNIGTVVLPGPVSYAGITLAETSGDFQSRTFIPISCPVTATLTASQYCNVYGDLVVGISGGDAPFNITGAGVNLPTTGAIGATTIFGNNLGPNTWTSVTVTEQAGNTETQILGDITCNKAMYVTAVCAGDDLLITILGGDVSFDIADGATVIQSGVALGTTTLTGPITIGDLTITETGGDAESQSLGGYGCNNNTLTARAVCVDDDLQITITNGNAPFSISVTDSGSTTNLGGLPLGSYTFNGPDTFTSIGITEDTSDFETLNFLDITCIAPVTPPAPVVLSPDLTALGCVLTQDVLAPDAPDNTYCRVLMKNGAVINYSGAVPRPLIDLGVIYAVDVYRLEGGRSITSFPNYTRVCLGGLGRLFYLDARTSPRSMTELATETLDGMTCGWIPAVGTLVLTQ